MMFTGMKFRTTAHKILWLDRENTVELGVLVLLAARAEESKLPSKHFADLEVELARAKEWRERAKKAVEDIDGRVSAGEPKRSLLPSMSASVVDLQQEGRSTVALQARYSAALGMSLEESRQLRGRLRSAMRSTI